MKLRLKSFYQNVNGVQIAPGEYESSDPALRGLASYLVQTGHAVVTQADTKPEDAPPESENDALFEDMTVAQLKALADEHHVELDGARAKADIIAKLVAAGINPFEAESDEV